MVSYLQIPTILIHFYPEYFILGLILLFMSPKKSRHANFELRMEELT